MSIPKKFILMKGFLLAQTYTSMIVKACPRNTRFTKQAIIVIRIPPNTNIIMKSAEITRAVSSSVVVINLVV